MVAKPYHAELPAPNVMVIDSMLAAQEVTVDLMFDLNETEHDRALVDLLVMYWHVKPFTIESDGHTVVTAYPFRQSNANYHRTWVSLQIRCPAARVPSRVSGVASRSGPREVVVPDRRRARHATPAEAEGVGSVPARIPACLPSRRRCRSDRRTAARRRVPKASWLSAEPAAALREERVARPAQSG